MSGVSWEAIMTMAVQESLGGTSNVAKKNNNFGGLTWSSDTQWKEEPYNGTKGTEKPEGGNYTKFPTKQQGLNAMANLMAQYGTINQQTVITEDPEIPGVDVSGMSKDEIDKLKDAKKDFDKILEKELDKLAKEPTQEQWADSWNYIKNKYPNISNEELDTMLRKWQFAPEASTSIQQTSEEAPTGKQAGTKTGIMPELTASPDSFNWEGMGQQWEETKKYLGLK
jgi:hypothetical protein